MADQWWLNAQSMQNFNVPRTQDPTLNRSQVDQLSLQAQERGDLRNDLLAMAEFERENEILAMIQNAFKKKGGGFNVPDEFAQNVALFQPGGQFGQGARMEIERGGQQAIAAGQVGLASTGMSSGTNVAGLQARVLADTALSRAKVEGERVERLGGALTQAGAARLSAEQLRAQREANLMRTLSSF
jgi:hypothetical protein